MKLRWIFVALAIVRVPALPAQTPDLHHQAWGQANRGLRIGIAVHSGNVPSVGAQFDVALENGGGTDFVVNLGEMLGNGKVMFPSSIRLALTDPSGRTRELRYFDRKYPGVAGRVDDFTVALRVGSVYVIRATLDNYWNPATRESGLKLTGGRHRIVARFEGEGARTANLDMRGAALMNFWKGTVESSPLEFEVPGSAATK